MATDRTESMTIDGRQVLVRLRLHDQWVIESIDIPGFPLFTSRHFSGESYSDPAEVKAAVEKFVRDQLG